MVRTDVNAAHTVCIQSVTCAHEQIFSVPLVLRSHCGAIRAAPQEQRHGSRLRCYAVPTHTQQPRHRHAECRGRPPRTTTGFPCNHHTVWKWHTETAKWNRGSIVCRFQVSTRVHVEGTYTVMLQVRTHSSGILCFHKTERLQREGTSASN